MASATVVPELICSMVDRSDAGVAAAAGVGRGVGAGVRGELGGGGHGRRDVVEKPFSDALIPSDSLSPPVATEIRSQTIEAAASAPTT